jgi:flavodoxin
MEYAVIYYSESGNTEMLAKEIYTALGPGDKVLINMRDGKEIPRAEVYFVGFPIHQKNCSIKIVDALEQIETGKLVLFATCGLTPTDGYRKKLEDAVSLWLPEGADYMGMFLCQGRTTEEQKDVFYRTNSEYQEKLENMFWEGDSHPNTEDMKDMARYMKRILQRP